MRIIAGEFKGRRMAAPRGQKVRPTSDRARETLFALLGQEITGSSFLDLFAGSGAVGLEALSRGAESAAFIERDRQAADVLRRNIESLKVSERCLMLIADWRQGCRRLKKSSLSFNVIFADPPYAEDLASRVLSSPLVGDILLPDGLLIIEHRRMRALPAPPGHLAHIKDHLSGDTAFALYRKEDLQ